MSKQLLAPVAVLLCSVLLCGDEVEAGGRVAVAAVAASRHADIAEFPYHVSVRQARRHVCSGALVHESWIITAASCVYDASVPRFSVLLGSTSLRNPPKNALVLNVSKIVVHQTFDRVLHTNNIALLKVESPLVYMGAPTLLPIFLPSSENYHLKDGSMLIVSGWKKLQVDKDHHGGGFESQLSVTGAPLVNQRTCIRSMPSHKAVSGKMLCAGYTDQQQQQQQQSSNASSETTTTRTRATCQADIGAPLANDDILVGILSSDGCKDTRYPAVYTKVSSFLPWISKILALDSAK